MFRGYICGNGNPPPDREFEAPKDKRSQTRLAVQTVANRNHVKLKTQKAQEEEDSVFQQSGYGDSDSDDDCGGVKVTTDDPDHEKNAEEAFTLPIHRNAKKTTDKEKKQNEIREEFGINPFSSFPAGPNGINPYARAPSVASTSSTRKSKKRSRSRESSRRRRSRSSSLESTASRFTTSSKSSRRRDDSEERRRKKRKKRRRHSSSSDSSSSSSDSDRRRSKKQKSDKNDSGRRDSVKKTSQATPKYEYLRKDVDFQTDRDWIFRHQRKEYGENALMGTPKSEIAKIRLGAHFVLGMEHNLAMFRRLYGNEIGNQKRARDFYGELATLERRPIEDRQRMERDFNVETGQVKDGYWKLRMKRCILNELHNDTHDPSDFNLVESRRLELDRLRNHVKTARSDESSMLRLIELEEEANFGNQDSFTGHEIRSLAEYHYQFLEKSIKQAPRSVALRLKRMECLWKSQQDITKISCAAKAICDQFPQDPLVWTYCLDFFQHDLTTYDDQVMSDNFLKCLDKAHDMLAGIMVSHEIADLPAFRAHYLSNFIRYLKWLLAVGHTPIALASIQSTMEFNFGFPLTSDIDDRYRLLNHFWDKKFPRIGDIQACGGQRMLMMDFPHEKSSKLESEDYINLMNALSRGTYEILQGEDLRLNWVRFERFMADADARPKRNPLEQSAPYLADEDVTNFNFYEEVEFRVKNVREPTRKKQVMTFYPSVENDEFEFVQPMLELLGIRFLHSTGCYTSTEQVISEWISYDDSFREDRTNFDEIPTYTEKTCGEIGQRTMMFLMNQRHEKSKKCPKDLDEQLMKYMIAKTVTFLDKMEKKLTYYRFEYKNVTDVLGACLNPIDEELKEILNTYPRIKTVVSLIISDRIVTWTERAMEEQLFLKRLDQMVKAAKPLTQQNEAILLKHALIEGDEQTLTDVRNKAFGMLTSLNTNMVSAEMAAKPLGDPTLPYVPLQIRLYSTITTAKMYVIPGCEARIRRELAMTLMDDPRDVIVGMDTNGRLWPQVNLAMMSLLDTIGKRDREEGMCGLPELPRAKTLCTALRNALYFVFLGKNPLARKTIDDITTEALEQFREYERMEADFSRGAAEKHRDRIDVQFMLDTLISLFSQLDYRTYYCENYRKLVMAASNTFPCHSKYMKLLADLFTGNRHQLIQLRGIINERNKVIREKMKTQADVSFERCLLQNSLAIMYATKKICDKCDTDTRLMLYRAYLAEAKSLHDPAIWRMVLKQAATISMKTLKDEAYILAVGQCKYARNVHLDFVELMECPDPKIATDLVQMITLQMIEVATEEQLTVFVDEFELIHTMKEVVEQRKMDKNGPITV